MNIVQNGQFRKVGAYEENKLWQNFVKREEDLYGRHKDIRSEFEKDYDRILQCTAYRRLKHKTQVFFATNHDHVCTRIEHVNHVENVSYNIAKYLGLNTELTRAIAIGHDLGHAPFGHTGEGILKKIVEDEIGESYWHEKNSLKFVDSIETLQDQRGDEKNLNLTYAVRDGIINHCGEVDENVIKPRKEYIDLKTISRPNEYAPYTWEGCVVKISDKISYLGRDIEDAITLKILSPEKMKELTEIVGEASLVENGEINNTLLMHNFVIDLCENSIPEDGLKFSKNYIQLMNSIKKFNYDNIYGSKRLEFFRNYAALIIKSIYSVLMGFYFKGDIFSSMDKVEKCYPELVRSFKDWIKKYSYGEMPVELRKSQNWKNKNIYNLSSKRDYVRAVIDYITGMTDQYAIKIFNELIKF
ncbi:hypothetical protein CUB90_03000 [Clostridium sp. CT7]|uniref:deoxyguanosinetriphosphate triphosphohydrolase family protein n=2 Tax=Clostridium TaxID=1485 RepID=UPI000824D605|nr:HD domain-containing protein [Clostridium sp. CT7]PJI06896.1 hypothetical protein CUB90_03000 [Clostridium sp. CT7]